jgi:hypothetical protein
LPDLIPVKLKARENGIDKSTGLHTRKIYRRINLLAFDGGY